ncbi:MAG: helix-turn-helix domain-containing protein [Clostridia bacterium]|nr:helix-turn-helix domain-containing protein [Clostridia bacterium]
MKKVGANTPTFFRLFKNLLCSNQCSCIIWLQCSVNTERKIERGVSVKIKYTFGTFIKEKRKERGISLRRFAEEVGISPVYLSNLENDRMTAPKDEVVSTIARLMKLTEADTAILYDLAAKTKNSVVVPQDLPDYIMDRDIVRVALRTAKDVDATDEEWQEFIAQLKARRRNNQEGE